VKGDIDEGIGILQSFQDWAYDIPKPISYTIAVIFGIAGFIIGLFQPQHHPQYLFALVGAFLGLIFIPLVVALIRFAIYWLLWGVVALIVYYAFFAR
jgi:hypothetical protein